MVVHYGYGHEITWMGMLAVPALLGIAIFAWWYARYLGIRYLRGLALALGGLVIVFVWAWGTKGEILKPSWLWSLQPEYVDKVQARFLIAIAYVTTVMLELGLVAKVYMAAVMDRMSAEERLADRNGVRAW